VISGVPQLESSNVEKIANRKTFRILIPSRCHRMHRPEGLADVERSAGKPSGRLFKESLLG
jgi:hypothetical protein